MVNGMTLSGNISINMAIIFKGIVTGLLLSVLVGATFFMLIETSMTRGFKAALWFDFGVVCCDATIIFAVYFFASWITSTLVHNQFFNVAGGVMFMVIGANYIFIKQPLDQDSIVEFKKRNFKLFMSGFGVNLMNPSVFLFWLGTVAVTLSKFDLSGKETFLFYASALTVMALSDVLKAFFASRIANFINSKVLRIVYVLTGIVMFGFGITFILK
jgi:threonine/homoserine/homoserine lactone efflux protein